MLLVDVHSTRHAIARRCRLAARARPARKGRGALEPEAREPIGLEQIDRRAVQDLRGDELAD